MVAAVIALVAVFYIGLNMARRFALSIAQDNHDAIVKEDAAAEMMRLRKEREADAAVSIAHQKVLELEMEQDKSLHSTTADIASV